MMPTKNAGKLIIDLPLKETAPLLPLFELFEYNEEELSCVWKQAYEKHATIINGSNMSFPSVELEDYIRASVNIYTEYGQLLGIVPLSLYHSDKSKIQILSQPPSSSARLLESLQLNPKKLNALSKLFTSYQIVATVCDLHRFRLHHSHVSLDNIFINPEGLVQLGCPNFSHSFTTSSFQHTAEVVKKSTAAATTTKKGAPPSASTASSSSTLSSSASSSSLLLQVTMQWLRGQMGNFDYIIYLNKLAGRRYGDPNFHYMLPWVTDFSQPFAGYRDLSKSKFRLTKGDAHMDMLYASSCDTTDDDPHRQGGNTDSKLPWQQSSGTNKNSSRHTPHHISDVMCNITYYSYKARQTPRHVLCKYVRSVWRPQEYPLSMQRMFAWTPDECIPEFFTDPTIFQSIHEDMANLLLPDWCATPDQFLAYHRAVLESEAVSENLHHWIDITFGYKLLGTDAIEAKNVHLHPITEESHLSSHGLVCLFRQPHPKRFKNSINNAFFAAKRFNLMDTKPLQAVPYKGDHPSICHELLEKFEPLHLLEQHSVLYDFILGCTGSTKVKTPAEASPPQLHLSDLQFHDCLSVACVIVELFLCEYFSWDPALMKGRRLAERVIQARHLLAHYGHRCLPHCLLIGLTKILQPSNKRIQSLTNLRAFCPSMQHFLFLIPFPLFMPDLRNLLMNLFLHRSPTLQEFSTQQLEAAASSRKQSKMLMFKEFLKDWTDFLIHFGAMSTCNAKGGLLCESYVVDLSAHSHDVLNTAAAVATQQTALSDVITTPMHTLILPLFLRLISWPKLSTSVLWHSFHHVCQLVDRKTKLEVVLPAVLRVYTTPVCYVESMELYGRSFIKQLILQFGLENFLAHISPVLIETISQRNAVPPRQGSDNGGGGGGMAPHTKEEEASAPGSTHLEEWEQEDVVQALSTSAEDGNSLKDDLSLTISMVAADTVNWLCDRLGPLITAQYFTNNLLRMLVWCYSPNEHTKSWPVVPCPVDLLSHNYTFEDAHDGVLKCLLSDLQGHELIACLRHVVHLYGSSFVVGQYLRFIKQTFRTVDSRQPIAVEDNRKRTAEGGMIAAIMLLQHLLITNNHGSSSSSSSGSSPSGVSILSHTLLMDLLHKDIILGILQPAIDACVNPLLFTFSGTHGRKLLASRLVDTICLLSVCLGFELTRRCLTPVLKRFFSTFTLIHKPEQQTQRQSSSTEDTKPIPADAINDLSQQQQLNFMVTFNAHGETNVTPVDNRSRSHSQSTASEFSAISVKSSSSSLLEEPTPPGFWAREDISDDIRQQWADTFTAELAHQAYIPMCRIAGDIHMTSTLPDAALIDNLIQTHQQSLDNRQTYRGPRVMLQEMKWRGLLVPDKQQDDADITRIHISGESDNMMRRLNDSWTAYWQHNIGVEKSSFDLKQVALAEFEGHTGAVRVLRTLTNENSFLSCGVRDKTVRLWSLNPAWTMRDCGGGGNGVGGGGVGGSANDSIVINESFKYSWHKRGVFAAEFMPTERLVTSCDGEYLHLWDPFTGAKVRKIHAGSGIFVAMTTTSSSFGSAQILVMDQDGRLSVIDTRIGHMSHQITVSSTPFYSFVTGQNDSANSLSSSTMDLPFSSPSSTVSEYPRRRLHAMSEDSGIASVNVDSNPSALNSSNVFSTASSNAANPPPPISGSIRHLHSMPNGHTAIWSYSTGSVMALDLRSGQTTHAWRAHSDEILQLNSLTSMDGSNDWLITAGADQNLHAWDLTASSGSIPKRHSFMGHQNEGAVHNYAPLGDNFIVNLSHNRLGCYKSLNSYSSYGKLSNTILKGAISALSAFPMNRLLLVASDHGKIVLLY